MLPALPHTLNQESQISTAPSIQGSLSWQSNRFLKTHGLPRIVLGVFFFIIARKETLLDRAAAGSMRALLWQLASLASVKAKEWLTPNGITNGSCPFDVASGPSLPLLQNCFAVASPDSTESIITRNCDRQWFTTTAAIIDANLALQEKVGIMCISDPGPNNTTVEWDNIPEYLQRAILGFKCSLPLRVLECSRPPSPPLQNWLEVRSFDTPGACPVALVQKTTGSIIPLMKQCFALPSPAISTLTQDCEVGWFVTSLSEYQNGSWSPSQNDAGILCVSDQQLSDYSQKERLLQIWSDVIGTCENIDGQLKCFKDRSLKSWLTPVPNPAAGACPVYLVGEAYSQKTPQIGDCVALASPTSSRSNITRSCDPTWFTTPLFRETTGGLQSSKGQVGLLCISRPFIKTPLQIEDIPWTVQPAVIGDHCTLSSTGDASCVQLSKEDQVPDCWLEVDPSLGKSPSASSTCPFVLRCSNKAPFPGHECYGVRHPNPPSGDQTLPCPRRWFTTSVWTTQPFAKSDEKVGLHCTPEPGSIPAPVSPFSISAKPCQPVYGEWQCYRETRSPS